MELEHAKTVTPTAKIAPPLADNVIAARPDFRSTESHVTSVPTTLFHSEASTTALPAQVPAPHATALTVTVLLALQAQSSAMAPA